MICVTTKAQGTKVMINARCVLCVVGASDGGSILWLRGDAPEFLRNDLNALRVRDSFEQIMEQVRP